MHKCLGSNVIINYSIDVNITTNKWGSLFTLSYSAEISDMWHEDTGYEPLAQIQDRNIEWAEEQEESESAFAYIENQDVEKTE